MWVLIRKDLLRRWRSPLSTLVMIIFPLFMSLALGSVFKGGGSQDFPRTRVLIENRDEKGVISNFLTGMSGQEETQDYLELVAVGPGEGRALMENGKASALVVLPDSFSAYILSGRPAELQVVRNPAEGIKPEIVVQGAGAVATYLDQASRIMNREFGAIEDLIEADELPAATRVGAIAAGLVENLQHARTYLFPPLVSIGSLKEAAEEDEGAGNGIFGYVLIMTTVMALLFVASRSMGDVFDEKNNGMLRRLLATPVDVGLVVGAKTVFGLLFGVVVLTILAAAGLALKWIAPPIDPWAALILGLAFSLAACGFLALIVSLVRTEKQAGILGWLVIMGMSALGGSMIPVEAMPAPMQAAAPFTVNYWAIAGFKDLVFDGAGLAAIGRDVITLLGMGLGTSLLAHLLLVRRLRELT